MSRDRTPVDVDACLLAGRRAMLAELQSIASAHPGQITYGGPNPEDWPLSSPICIANANITSAIDAVVMETIVRMEHPDRAPTKAKRRWWRFW